MRVQLTPANIEILGLLATDLSQREMGVRLSLNTSKTHTRNVCRKLGASSARTRFLRTPAPPGLRPGLHRLADVVFPGRAFPSAAPDERR